MTETLATETLNLPSIRIAITDVCNMHCSYCPKAGDSVEIQHDRLESTEFEQLVDVALDTGFTNYSITGGEPLLNDQVSQRAFRLAQYINQGRAARCQEGYTKLNTNGANLLRYRDEVLANGFDEIKVSLDTLDPITFKSLNGRNEGVFEATIAGIFAVKDHVPVRLQTVIGKYNASELSDIIRFCRSNGLGLKLFDISRYDNALAGSGLYSEENYIPLTSIIESLRQEFGKPVIKYAVGGFGHAKKVFTTPEDTNIEVRDTSISAHYSLNLCESCPKYMCQDGLCNLVIAADGHIRFCREGGSNQTYSTRETTGQLLPVNVIRQKFMRASGIFAAASSIERPIQATRRSLPLFIIGS